MTYEVTLFFRQFWIDPRLAWGETIENGETIEYKRVDETYNVAADMVDLLWVPDTFFIDEIGKVGCVFPMVVVSILPNADFGQTDYQEDALNVMFLIHCFDQMDQNLLPNLFLDSRRHTIMTKNVFLEIHSNGHILFSERLTMKLKCPMHLRYYPFDLQICPIRIESYAFRDSQVSFKS